MTQIVVSRRDGILTAPDGTKHRVARGKTLAEADHPAVLANPGDWVPMVVTLALEGREPGAAETPADDELREQVAELEETLAARDAELTRLAEGLESAGIELPAEGDRAPGWLVDLALGWIDVDRAQVAASIAAEALPPAPAPQQQAPAIAPPKPRRRTAPPLPQRTADDA